MFRSTRGFTRRRVPIRFGTYNIRNSRNGRLESTLRVMSKANLDLGVFQETKLTGGVYTCGSAGYIVFAMDAPSQHRSGVTLFYQLSPQYAVEAIQNFGPNVVGFQMVIGERPWYIIGYYLAPDNILTIESVVAALKECPWGSELMVTGDLNGYLDDPEVYRKEEDITAVMTTAELEDMSSYFLP